MRKLLVFSIIAALFSGMLMFTAPKKVQAATDNDTLSKLIEEVIDSDKKVLEDLSPVLKKAYDKIVAAIKKAGSIAKDITKVVKMYEALDETSQDYPEKLQKFFEAYNKLGTVKRKVVDFCTGVLNSKDELLDNLRRLVLVDFYSEKNIKSELTGTLTYKCENENIATVSTTGLVKPVSVGFTSITVTNASGDEEVFRVFVKKPILSTKITVAKGSIVKIPVSDSMQVLEIKAGNDKISFTQNTSDITVTGLKKGTSYLYIGTKTGITVKIKIKVK
ncbi:MAG: Ig-like domain-containing protein [Lachnospiraceae bacterium]|nr:Ig-like domain-containing protein [Lachnospiraceae bacterium]